MQFKLETFLPYLLNQAAEAASKEFQSYYRNRYGMLRTEWRVLFHIALYGPMTATRICQMASLHKTKVSRAVTALEKKRFVLKTTDEADRRAESLSLTPRGQSAFDDLNQAAERYEADLVKDFTADELRQLQRILLKIQARGTGAI